MHIVQAGPRAGCDVDYGWLPGAAGTDKCYMLVKSDSRWPYNDFTVMNISACHNFYAAV